ncbi:sensor domain-containing diguanylate cyclase [Bowmanella denitrificans]|uniref:sensor domain-containing diguanylate cyclase n=1 Tax=Bowmanella denitrificans TaxID=366582 RepID=UPI000C9AB07C|nr:diguanylate cyclase [Bowmanella denitrificans]
MSDIRNVNQGLSVKSDHQTPQQTNSRFSTQTDIQSLERNLLNLHQFVNAIAEAVFVINNQGVIEMLNPQMASVLAQPKQNLIGQKWHHLLHENYRSQYQQLTNSWQGRNTLPITHGPAEVVLNRATGGCIEIDLSLSVLPTEICAGERLILGVVHNLSHYKAQYQALRKQAYTDCLTGLANRHHLQESLALIWGESVSNQQPLSLIIIDIDYFKAFNDKYGHVNGDRCLKSIAQVIKAQLPARDCLAARYGGEEFVVLMPRCHLQDAELLAKNIQSAVSRLEFARLGLPASTQVTVSQGVACEFNGQFRTAEALLCAADTALYRAKNEGRNRISLCF